MQAGEKVPRNHNFKEALIWVHVLQVSTTRAHTRTPPKLTCSRPLRQSWAVLSEPTALTTRQELCALGLVVLPLPPPSTFLSMLQGPPHIWSSRSFSWFFKLDIISPVNSYGNASVPLLGLLKKTSTLLFIHISDILWWTVSAWRAGFMSDPFLYLSRDLAQ